MGSKKKCIYEYSKNDYVLFLSDDDELLDTDFIKKSLELIKNNIVEENKKTKLRQTINGLYFFTAQSALPKKLFPFWLSQSVPLTVATLPHTEDFFELESI